MNVTGSFAQWELNGKLNGNAIFFPFCSKIFNIFFKSASRKDSNTSVITKQVEKNLKKCFRKKFSLCQNNWWENPVSLSQMEQNLIQLWGLKVAIFKWFGEVAFSLKAAQFWMTEMWGAKTNHLSAVSIETVWMPVLWWPWISNKDPQCLSEFFGSRTILVRTF